METKDLFGDWEQLKDNDDFGVKCAKVYMSKQEIKVGHKLYTIMKPQEMKIIGTTVREVLQEYNKNLKNEFSIIFKGNTCMFCLFYINFNFFFFFF